MVSCRKTEDVNEDTFDERLSGGQQTVFDETSGAFGHGFPMMYGNNAWAHGMGDAAFNASFVTAPALVNGGLGPLYNAVSCVRCHVNDGKGKPPLDGAEIESLLIRLSMPGTDAHGMPLSVPNFGNQLQNRAIQGHLSEAKVNIIYNFINGSYNDGVSYSLANPSYNITSTYYSLPGNYLFSPRIAQSLHGLGLLEAVSEHTILEYADPSDVNTDGISGRPNYVYDVIKKANVLGRFGWKCNQPNLKQQTAAAYNGDMGVTNSLFPEENSFGQIQNDNINDDHEISDSILDLVTFYVRSLGVPARRNTTNESVLKGKKLFKAVGCESCHRETIRTGTNMAFKEVSNQVLHPYTDMLLHDMGDALSDNRPDGLANGKEWRTAPLWGLGLQKRVNGHTFLLHDGRARNIEESILWHGGEGENSKNKFKSLNQQERQQLLDFLNDL